MLGKSRRDHSIIEVLEYEYIPEHSLSVTLDSHQAVSPLAPYSSRFLPSGPWVNGHL